MAERKSGMTKNYTYAHCGAEFWPYNNPKQQYCSKACRESANKLKRLEQAAAKLQAKLHPVLTPKPSED